MNFATGVRDAPEIRKPIMLVTGTYRLSEIFQCSLIVQAPPRG